MNRNYFMKNPKSQKVSYLKSFQYSLLTNWSVRYLLESSFGFNDKYELAPIGQFLIRNKELIQVEDDTEYKRVTIKINNNGVIQRDIERGKNIGTKRQYIVRPGQFIMSKIDARNGAFGLIPPELDGAIVTNDFPSFNVDNDRINTQFLVLITTTKAFIKFAQSSSSGTTNRQRIDLDLFLQQKIPLPTLEEQDKIVEDYNNKIQKSEELKNLAIKKSKEIEFYLFDELGINPIKKNESKSIRFRTISFKDISEWGINKINYTEDLESTKYPIVNLESNLHYKQVTRGKSPKYSKNKDSIILNQKCNRWNSIELEHAKSVDSDWLATIDTNQFTVEGDVLVNSTGEGTIGRATCISKDYSGLMYDSHLLLLRLKKENVNSTYYTELFNSYYGQRQVENIKSAQTTKQTELGINNLKKVFFPIPPLSKQDEIAQTISNMKSEMIKLLEDSRLSKNKAGSEFEKEIFNYEVD